MGYCHRYGETMRNKNSCRGRPPNYPILCFPHPNPARSWNWGKHQVLSILWTPAGDPTTNDSFPFTADRFFFDPLHRGHRIGRISIYQNSWFMAVNVVKGWEIHENSIWKRKTSVWGIFNRHCCLYNYQNVCAWIFSSHTGFSSFKLSINA